MSILSFLRKPKKQNPISNRPKFSLAVEQLEDRSVPATFSVDNLFDAGIGSLRAAMLDANDTVGHDVIDFNVAGTIQLASALPTIFDSVDIDATTSPGFAGTPTVEIDYNGFGGLRFDLGSAGSSLQSLALGNATGSGVMLNGVGGMLITGNFIGLRLDGVNIAPNSGDGLELIGSSGNTIVSNVISGNAGNGIGLYASINVTYDNVDSVPNQPVSAWQGLRASSTNGQYLIVGTSGSSGLLFEGTIDGAGNSYLVNYPGALTTSVYGPNNLGSGNVQLVGSYKNPGFATDPVTVNGFLYTGTTADLNVAANYRTVSFDNAKYTYVHSTMGGLAVGNFDNYLEHGNYSLPLGPGHAFIYDIDAGIFITEVVYPDAISNTAYGIWHNGGTSYTIVGGYSFAPANNFDDQNRALAHGYIVDYDSTTGLFTNWASYDYPNGNNFVTHFEGISSVEPGVYTLNADSVQSGSSNPAQGSWVTVRRNGDGSFGTARWVDLNHTSYNPTTNITSSNAVYGNQVVGVVIGTAGVVSYQATIDTVITSDGNTIAMNSIGTDATGTLDRGNVGNGIMLTDGAANNLIGGDATGGNDPTNDVFVRPPQGNLISGNNAHGVILTGGATLNTLSGNFIGTTADGNVPLGNALDGVAIDNADGNSLIGCTITDDPFVFYNVISGNGGNGLRVTNSDNTTIQANFFGIGADNDTAVGNALNGVLVEGSSAFTILGGPIPLGNVIAANLQNGIEVRDTASDFTSYNTFAGLAAFSENLTLGNGMDGMHITSTGANILIRTNVIARNGDDGIEISGAATGVRVTGNIIGLNTSAAIPMGNGDNGIEVGGSASSIIIGGPQVTFNIIPYNIISANGGNGIAIIGVANNIHVDASYIGTDFFGTTAFGNAHAGILMGPGTAFNTIGSPEPSLRMLISGNLGDGIQMFGSVNNTVVGTLIGTDFAGVRPLPNAGNGVSITNGFNNTIGRFTGTAGAPANIIAFNGANGVLVNAGIQNGILENAIYANTLLGIDLLFSANLNVVSPVITNVQTHPFGIQVTGIVTGLPFQPIRVEFFANETDSASGRYLLGSQLVLPNIGGTGVFTFNGELPPAGATYITATATIFGNNTSEFSSANSAFGPSGPIAAAEGYDMPLIHWNAVLAADHYYLVVIDDTTGTAAIVVPNVSGTSYQTLAGQALTPGHSFTTYVYAVTADGRMLAPATQTFSLANLPAPTLNGPTGVITPSTGYDMPIFSWNASAGAATYRLYVVDNATGLAVIDQANLTGLTYVTPSGQALTPGHSYTWYVLAYSTNGLANNYLPGVTFSLAQMAAPTLNGPTGVITPSTGYDMPTFSWNASVGAATYRLYVVDNATGLAVIDQANLTGLTYVTPTGQALTPGHSYTWYVLAYSTNGLGNAYLPGVTFSLAQMAAPTLNGPTGVLAPVSGYDMPNFSWNAAAGAATYRLYVVDNATGLAVIDQANITALSYATPTGQALTPGHSYTWYVLAYSTNGLGNAYLPGATLSLAAMPNPVLLQPSGVSNNVMPTFSWTSVPAATRYVLYVYDYTTNSSPSGIVDVTNTIWTSTVALTPGHNYRWWVASVSANGSFVWVDNTLEFTIVV